jgi:hypothetical protein
MLYQYLLKFRYNTMSRNQQKATNAVEDCLHQQWVQQQQQELQSTPSLVPAAKPPAAAVVVISDTEEDAAAPVAISAAASPSHTAAVAPAVSLEVIFFCTSCIICIPLYVVLFLTY